MLHAVKNERGNMVSCDAEHSKLGERGKGDKGGGEEKLEINTQLDFSRDNIFSAVKR